MIIVTLEHNSIISIKEEEKYKKYVNKPLYISTDSSPKLHITMEHF